MGGQKIEVKPIGLENAIELVLLIMPYLVMIEDFKPQFEQALKTNDNGLLSAMLKSLAKDMKKSPGDIVKMVSLLTGKPIEWIAIFATGEEVVKAFPVFDRVNDFRALLSVFQDVTNG